MTALEALTGASIALIDAVHGMAKTPLTGWRGADKITFTEYQVLEGARYDEANSSMTIPALFYPLEFDPMLLDQHEQRAAFIIAFRPSGAHIKIDLEADLRNA